MGKVIDFKVAKRRKQTSKKSSNEKSEKQHLNYIGLLIGIFLICLIFTIMTSKNDSLPQHTSDIAYFQQNIEYFKPFNSYTN